MRAGVSFALAALAAALLAATATGTRRPGYFPRPLFGTPGKAAYCNVEMAGEEDGRATLFCWTPNDGWGVRIPWNARRAYAEYHNHGPLSAEDYGDLRGYAPRAKSLRFGQRWAYRCSDPADQTTCHVGGSGVTAFTCTSRSSGLTCMSAARHGWWIGRFRGYRLF